MRHTSRLVGALATATVAAGCASVVLKTANGNPPGDILLTTVGGGAFLVSGLVAARCRPGNATGTLMLLVALGLFVEDLQMSRVPLLFTLGLLTINAAAPAMVALILAFPTGRLTPVGRALVAGACVLAFGLQAVRVTFLGVGYYTPERTNLLLVRPDRTVDRAVAEVSDTLTIVLGVALLAVLVHRWRSATPPLRRVLAPVYGAGVACGALTVASFAAVKLGADGGQDVGMVVYGLTFAALPMFFVAALLRTRLTTLPAVDRLASTHAAPDDVQAALRRALADPSLTLYPTPDAEAVDAARAIPGRDVTLLHEGDRVLAMLVHDPAVAVERQAFVAVLATTRLLLARERLRAEIDSRVHALSALNARLAEAAAHGRRQVERDLHDGAQQHIVTLSLQLALLERSLAEAPDASGDAIRLARAAAASAHEALGAVRDVARGAHPALLSEAGLVPALHALADRSPVPVEVDAVARFRPPAAIAHAAYCVAAEGVTNALKHAGATRLVVRCLPSDDVAGLVVSVTDDGCGGAAVVAGGGLSGLRDRVTALGGSLDVTDSPAGCTVRAVLPLGDGGQLDLRSGGAGRAAEPLDDEAGARA